MSRNMSQLFVTAMAAVAIGLFSAGDARADVTATCNFLEISASSGDPASMPAELKPLAKKLKRPPFSSWNRFQLLSSSEKSLPKLVAQTLQLSNGKAEVLLRDIVQGNGKRARISFSVTIDDQNGKRVVDTKANVDGGDYFVVGRSLPNNDGHLLAMTCRL